MSELLQKQIILKTKKNKCGQPDCRSKNLDNMEILVFGEGDFKKRGLMCSGCFIDHELISKMDNIEHHSLPIQKFMKFLTKQYCRYAEVKNKKDWPPNMIEQEKESIRKKVIQLEKEVEKGIMQIMKYVEDGAKKAIEDAKKVNHDVNMEKLLQLISEEEQQEQERINVSKQIKEVTEKLKMEEGQCKYIPEDNVKKQNERIIGEYRKKAFKAKQYISKLIEVHKKCIKHLVQ